MTSHKLNSEQNKLRRRILEIIYRDHNSHIGSCLSVVDIINAIYAVKKKKEKFVLSCGHSAVALYVILEKYGFLKNPSIKELSVHPNRNIKKGIDLSTGSLGQGLPIALGMALASPKKNVYCLISDGECAEGSIWESLRLARELKAFNLKIALTANGWSALGSVDLKLLERRLKGFGYDLQKVDGQDSKALKKVFKRFSRKNDRATLVFAGTKSDELPFLHGLEGHYHVMTEADYLLAEKILR